MKTDESRIEDRWALSHQLPVTDRDNGGFLGHLVNVSYSGMAIVGQIPIAPETRLAIRIDTHPLSFSPSGDGDEPPTATVHSVWSRGLSQPESYLTGLHIFVMSPSSRQTYRELIKRFGVRLTA